MNNNEKKISDYIDRLNAEKKPNINEHTAEEQELKELIQTVNKIHSLKEPNLPDADFEEKLTKTIQERMTQKQRNRKKKWPWISSIASVAAILLFTLLNAPIYSMNIVNAMEQAYEEIEAYHGILEVIGTNAEGESTTQSRMEVWANKDGNYYMKGLEGPHKGIITVNNGEKKWQLLIEEEQINVFPAFPDPYSFIFEIGNEIELVKGAVNTKKIGEEIVAGRETTILEVTPKGGEAYLIWIDNKTKLPLKKETAMNHALQYTTTYTEIEFSKAIPSELLAYEVPKDFDEIIENTEQVVSNMEEAVKLSGFVPILPNEVPEGYTLDKITFMQNANRVKVYYRTKKEQIVVIQSQTNDKFEPASNARLGTINNQVVEIQSPLQADTGVLGGGMYAGVTNLSSIRWQENGYEFAVVGNANLINLEGFTNAISDGTLELPTKEIDATNGPKVEVHYDLEVEKSNQQNVDAGSSPWMLDAKMVTQVFVSLLITPEGILGDYSIAEEDLSINHNTGTEAIIEVGGEETPVTRVYLKRLIRQDSTGIWTVVGYDPVQ